MTGNRFAGRRLASGVEPFVPVRMDELVFRSNPNSMVLRLPNELNVLMLTDLRTVTQLFELTLPTIHFFEVNNNFKAKIRWAVSQALRQ